MKLRKVYKWLPVILVILSCPLSSDRVVLANRHYCDPSSNLRGELSIKDSEGNWVAPPENQPQWQLKWYPDNDSGGDSGF